MGSLFDPEVFEIKGSGEELCEAEASAVAGRSAGGLRSPVEALTIEELPACCWREELLAAACKEAVFLQQQQAKVSAQKINFCPQYHLACRVRPGNPAG